MVLWLNFSACCVSQLCIINLLIGLTAWQSVNLLVKKIPGKQQNYWPTFTKNSLLRGSWTNTQTYEEFEDQMQKTVEKFEVDFAKVLLHLEKGFSGTVDNVDHWKWYLLIIYFDTTADNDWNTVEYLVVNGITSATTFCRNRLAINEYFPN